MVISPSKPKKTKKNQSPKVFRNTHFKKRRSEGSPLTIQKHDFGSMDGLLHELQVHRSEAVSQRKEKSQQLESTPKEQNMELHSEQTGESMLESPRISIESEDSNHEDGNQRMEGMKVSHEDLEFGKYGMNVHDFKKALKDEKKLPRIKSATSSPRSVYLQGTMSKQSFEQYFVSNFHRFINNEKIERTMVREDRLIAKMYQLYIENAQIRKKLHDTTLKGEGDRIVSNRCIRDLQKENAMFQMKCKEEEEKRKLIETNYYQNEIENNKLKLQIKNMSQEMRVLRVRYESDEIEWNDKISKSVNELKDLTVQIEKLKGKLFLEKETLSKELSDCKIQLDEAKKQLRLSNSSSEEYISLQEKHQNLLNAMESYFRKKSFPFGKGKQEKKIFEVLDECKQTEHHNSTKESQ